MVRTWLGILFLHCGFLCKKKKSWRSFQLEIKNATEVNPFSYFLVPDSLINFFFFWGGGVYFANGFGTSKKKCWEGRKAPAKGTRYPILPSRILFESKKDEAGFAEYTWGSLLLADVCQPMLRNMSTPSFLSIHAYPRASHRHRYPLIAIKPSSLLSMVINWSRTGGTIYETELNIELMAQVPSNAPRIRSSLIVMQKTFVTTQLLEGANSSRAPSNQSKTSSTARPSRSITPSSLNFPSTAESSGPLYM